MKPTPTDKSNPAGDSAIYGPSNPTPQQAAARGSRYYGSIIELRPEKEHEYRQLHADVWPAVKAAIHKANIRNYNIFAAELAGKKYLFSYFEYVGRDPEKDFASIAQDPTTRDRWWPLTDACQTRLPGTPDGQQWKPLDQVMHLD